MDYNKHANLYRVADNLSFYEWLKQQYNQEIADKVHTYASSEPDLTGDKLREYLNIAVAVANAVSLLKIDNARRRESRRIFKAFLGSIHCKDWTRTPQGKTLRRFAIYKARANAMPHSKRG